MELQISEQQAAALVSMSKRTGRSPGDLVVEAVDRLLSQETWFDAQVQLAIEQIARGEYIDEDEMDARVSRMTQA